MRHKPRFMHSSGVSGVGRLPRFILTRLLLIIVTPPPSSVARHSGALEAVTSFPRFGMHDEWLAVSCRRMCCTYRVVV